MRSSAAMDHIDVICEGKFRAATQFDPRKDKQMPAPGAGTFQIASTPNSERDEFMLPGVSEGRHDVVHPDLVGVGNV